VTQVVEIDEVQGNVLSAYGPRFRFARYLRLTFDRSTPGVEAARWLLRRWNPRVTFGRPSRDAAGPHLNVAFSYSALRGLGLPPSLLSAFPADFRVGARARAAALGDRWPGEDWYRLPFRECDVLFAVHGRSHASCDPVARALLADVEAWPGLLSVVQDRIAGSTDLPPEAEPFGFSDGRSQPAVEGVDEDAQGDGVYAAVSPGGRGLFRNTALALEDLGLKRIRRQWRLLRPGEFVLGYMNEDDVRPEGPPAPLGPNGTFAVYREMPQDVDGFAEYTKSWGERLGMDPKALAAKIIGRRQDGTSLLLSRENGARAVAHRRRANYFLYEEDPDGFACPFGAHVRRANPRDALPGGSERTMRHRIIRRGLPYSVPANDDDPAEFGLVFVCFSASIAAGFEFIQTHWINRGDGLGLGTGPDFLLQQRGDDGTLAGQLLIPGYRNVVLDPPSRPFVGVRGCEYLFVPSRAACEWIVRDH
jgi:deferrochelatase/peroxidase EfeB